MLAGLSVPDEYWKQHNTQLENIKSNYGLADAEVHVAWMMRPYLEQQAFPGFESMTAERWRTEGRRRHAELLRLQKMNNPRRYKQTRKNYQKTEAYVHLTLDERWRAVTGIAKIVSQWGVVRLFDEDLSAKGNAVDADRARHRDADVC